MKQYHLEKSPIVYYISRKEKTEWILFIHAAFVNHNMFQTQIDYFRDKYNILTLDIIGHGKSTKVRKGDSIDKMSAWISEILKTEKIEKIHIVGISLGAVLAQDFANQYPEAVQSLACFGGYDINNFDAKMQKENSASQTLMMLKAIFSIKWFATVYKGNIIKNLIMDCQSYTKYRPNETTGGIFVSWRRKEELPTGA